MSKYNVSVISNVKELTTHELELKQPKDKQVLLKVDSCAICTLEQRVYNGVMQRYPFAGGHEVAGIIESVGKDVKNVKPGDKVAIFLLTSCGECYYCRKGFENQCVHSFKTSIHEGFVGPGGFSEYMLLDSKRVYKLSDDIDLSHASLTEPLACCVHSVNNASIELGNDVVVIGVGIMGAFHIQLAKLRGARVIACDLNDERLKVAKKLGADIVINSKNENTIEKVKGLTEGRGADVVFCTVAISELAADSIAMAGKLGRVIMYSSFHPDNPIELSVNKVHSSEMIITGAVNPRRTDFLAATRLLSHKLVTVSDLISDIISIEEIDKAFNKAIDPSTYRIIVKFGK
ncbi:zinc-dependent alcohol dehydrogenase [Vallitalea maricola]|uniref:Alcohol dehydrogenase catalytic domain-containing protein n=1 Tax=Vallitalea maricola TaxID=3074433 RepID=A0ACB5UI13_9FIRM|nr:alcohol dehydrogenase catalytic domain-containing protein [Vallitalea sp. AN17-2]